MNGAREAASTTTPAMQRRGLLRGATAVMTAGAVTATMAHATPVASLGGDEGCGTSTADDALIVLCATFDDCERQVEAIYDTEPDDNQAEAAVSLVLRHQSELAVRIAGTAAHTADGIVAIARSVAIHNGNGAHDFDPSQGTTTGRLMTALLREVCLLSSNPAPSELAGRAAT